MTTFTTRTESIVPADSGFMEFNLEGALGYQEWRGFFAELGVKGCLFNAYFLQSSVGTARISTTPVQIHLFPHAIYLSPPFEQQEYYVEISRSALLRATVYFKAPASVPATLLDGHKPTREDLYAIDVWHRDGLGQDVILTLVYEATIPTDRGDYQIKRFDSEQLQ